MVFRQKGELAHPLQFSRQTPEVPGQQEDTMFDQRFFASKLGLSALVSVAAMVAFNLFAISQASGATPQGLGQVPAIAVSTVELA